MRTLHSVHYQTLVTGLMIACCVLLVACSAQNGSSTNGAQMAEANRLYESGEFPEATARLQALADAGVRDGRLYYNLGTAYLKTGDLGRAVLNFRRAQNLLPRDDDVAANLRLARAMTLDHIEIGGRETVASVARRIFEWSTLNEAAYTALLLWILVSALATGAMLSSRNLRRVLFVLAAIAGVLCLLVVLSIGIRWLDDSRQPPAVIVANEVSLHSGPGHDYLTEFSLHAGADVRIIERREKWVRVAIPGGLQGWAPDDAVIALFSDD